MCRTERPSTCQTSPTPSGKSGGRSLPTMNTSEPGAAKSVRPACRQRARQHEVLQGGCKAQVRGRRGVRRPADAGAAYRWALEGEKQPLEPAFCRWHRGVQYETGPPHQEVAQRPGPAHHHYALGRRRWRLRCLQSLLQRANIQLRRRAAIRHQLWHAAVAQHDELYMRVRGNGSLGSGSSSRCTSRLRIPTSTEAPLQEPLPTLSKRDSCCRSGGLRWVLRSAWDM